jgi:hypothetical protein
MKFFMPSHRIEKTLQNATLKKITIFLESFSTTIKCFSSLVMKSRGCHHHIQHAQNLTTDNIVLFVAD